MSGERDVCAVQSYQEYNVNYDQFGGIKAPPFKTRDTHVALNLDYHGRRCSA
jgi:hypothetical protein